MLGRDERMVGAYTTREPFEDTECLGSKDGMSSKKRKQRNFSLYYWNRHIYCLSISENRYSSSSKRKISVGNDSSA